MVIQTSLAARQQRWRQFMANQEPPRHLFTIHYTPDALPRPPLWPQLRRERIEWILQTWDRAMQRAQWLADDFVPCLDMQTGTEIFAEALGCDVYRPDNDMPCARPLIHSAAEVDRIKVPELSRSTLAYLLDMADELHRRAGREALFRLVDIQSPMDIAALIWDKNEFYAALVEEPEAVRALAGKVRQLLTVFLDEWFARYGRQHIAHYPMYWMDGGLTLSEDEVGSVNQECFVEMFLPELAELSNRYGGIGIHCCANARHQWENFKKVPGLKLLNIVHNRQMIVAAWDAFATHCAQMHNWAGDGDPWTWPAAFPPASRIVIEAKAETRQQALELAEKMPEACARKAG